MFFDIEKSFQFFRTSMSIRNFELNPKIALRKSADAPKNLHTGKRFQMLPSR